MSRSGGPKKGLLTPHGFGLIDADYYGNETNDGHFTVQVFNCSDHDVEIKKGDKIAQVMFTKYLIVDNDDASGVRTGGFGSTDKE
jgi:dUTP pyrophosphatase